MKRILWGAALLCLCLTGCQKESSVLRVAATPVPHAEMLMVIQPLLKSRGVHLKIVEVDDYNLPNRLLAEKQVDANFFQHQPFLEAQEKEFGYQFSIVKKIHFEPLGIYSSRLGTLDDLPQGGIIALPNDPTNEARALTLLAREGLLTLKPGSGSLATVLDIEQNPRKLRFHEVDAALIPRILPDVDLAVIPANFALQAHLFPRKDALALESGCSPFANLLVVRQGDEQRREIQLLAEALTSQEMNLYLKDTYQGALELTPCPQGK